MKHTMLALATILTTLILHGIVNSGRGVFGQGTDYYCSRDASDSVLEITGETEGSIYTLYPGDSHYQNNQNCMWRIDAGPNNRVEITVVSSNLQWAPPSAICPGYDHVAIKDDKNGGEESIVLQWCGLAQPVGAVSSGRYLRVEFMSDKNNPYQYTGVHLHFKTFSSSNCAPSWSNSTGGFCYKVMDTEIDWSAAQKECNTGGANLVSILSENEHDFLVQTFGSSAATAWIGLNDIVYQGDYKWIDGSQFAYSRFGKNHASNQYFRCVAMHFADETWQLKDCEKDISKPLCKSNKGSKTVIFPIPQPRADETDSSLPVGRVVAIAISTVVLVIVIIIGICVYRNMKEKRRKSSYHSPKPDSQGSQAVDLHEVRQEAPQPSAPPGEHIEEPVMFNPDARMLAPPAYEEALSHPVLSHSHDYFGGPSHK